MDAIHAAPWLLLAGAPARSLGGSGSPARRCVAVAPALNGRIEAIRVLRGCSDVGELARTDWTKPDFRLCIQLENILMITVLIPYLP